MALRSTCDCCHCSSRNRQRAKTLLLAIETAVSCPVGGWVWSEGSLSSASQAEKMQGRLQSQTATRLCEASAHSLGDRFRVSSKHRPFPMMHVACKMWEYKCSDRRADLNHVDSAAVICCRISAVGRRTSDQDCDQLSCSEHAQLTWTNCMSGVCGQHAAPGRTVLLRASQCPAGFRGPIKHHATC